MNTPAERELLDRALDALKTTTGMTGKILGGEPTIGADNHRADALIEIEAATGKHRFLAETKQVTRAEILVQIQARRPKTTRPPLTVVTPYMTAHLADRCRAIGLNFIDAAGNVYLHDRQLFVFVTGRKPTMEPGKLKTNRRTNAAGLRLLFTILCRPELVNAPYRQLAGAAGVALGTVGPVIKQLEADRYIAAFGKVRPMRRLIDLERLIEEWVTFYPAVLRPKLNPRRFLVPDRETLERADLTPYNAYWGGEVAAKRLTGHLKPERLTIYTRINPLKLIVDFRMRADLKGELEILDCFWDPKVVGKETDLVPPLLAYADLMATTDGRNLETAKLLYERHIASTLRTH